MNEVHEDTDPVTDTVTFAVLVDRLDELKATLTKLAKKANRYGSTPISFTIVGVPYEQKRQITDWDGETRKVTVCVQDVCVTGVAPTVGDYEFIARLELSEAGVLIHKAPAHNDVSLEQFQDSNGHCDHCKSNRRRNEVYVVRERTTGKFLQVGSTCLRDFLGVDDPRWIAARFEFFKNFRDTFNQCDEYSFVQSIRGTLRLASVAIRLFGWCSKTMARESESLIPTSYYTELPFMSTKFMSAKQIELRTKMINSATNEDDKTAQNVIDWVRGLDSEKVRKSDYLYNLSIIFGMDNITNDRHIGIVVSAVAAYHREMENELRYSQARKALLASEHRGELKQRLRDIPVTMNAKRVIGECSYSGAEKLLIQFLGEDNAVYVWFTTANLSDTEIGQKVKLTGTVVKHDEFNGVKQTVLSRVIVKA